uniref:Uncharacterized protein n=1 Tax=Timema monikensis TaxID=170555 RepID=A0A7R9E535_9NEOP|nr:unnamed protein product [Timema monikensis]
METCDISLVKQEIVELIKTEPQNEDEFDTCGQSEIKTEDDSETSNSIDEIVKTEIKLYDSSFGIIDSNINHFTPVDRSEAYLVDLGVKRSPQDSIRLSLEYTISHSKNKRVLTSEREQRQKLALPRLAEPRLLKKEGQAEWYLFCLSHSLQEGVTCYISNGPRVMHGAWGPPPGLLATRRKITSNVVRQDVHQEGAEPFERGKRLIYFSYKHNQSTVSPLALSIDFPANLIPSAISRLGGSPDIKQDVDHILAV